MKRILAILILLLARNGFGATITFTLTNYFESPFTNAGVRVFPVADPILANGTPLITGLPIRLAMNTNGVATTNLLQGNYLLTNTSPKIAIVFAVPDSTDTYEFTSLAISGFNTYNYSPGVQQVTAGEGITLGPTNGKGTVTVTGSLQTNIVYVSKNGSNSTGARNRPDKPFLSISNANVSAISGDVVHIFPGSYSELFSLKANLFFDPGAKLHYTATPPEQSTLALLSDTNGAVDISIIGGEFINQSGLSEGNTLNVIMITNALSKLSMQCRSLVITNSLVAGPDHVVHIANCARFNLITDKISQPIGLSASANGVYWQNGDNVYIHAKDISVVGNGVWEESPANTATPINMYVDSDLINADESAIYASGANTNAIMWIRSKLLISTNSNTISVVGTGKVYIDAQKIWGRSSAQPVIISTAGKSWIHANKITSEKMPYLQVGGGIVDITAQQYEDSLGTVTNGISVSGGTTAIHGGRIDATGYAVHHIGGTLRIAGAVISSSTNGGILVAGSGLTLKDCRIIAAAGQASVNAASAQTVTIDGTLTVNTAPSANITFQGGTLIVISNQTIYGNMTLATVGRSLQIKEGSNATMGTNSLNGTTAVTVSTTAVTASSRIFLSIQSPVGTPAAPYVFSRSAGSSFTVKSTGASDTSIFAWLIVEPSP